MSLTDTKPLVTFFGDAASLVASGYTTPTKAHVAEHVVGKLFERDGIRYAVFAADIRCTWFWVVDEFGGTGELSAWQMRNAPSLGHLSVPVRFERREDNRGEWGRTEYVYTADLADVLAGLRVGELEAA